MTFESREDSVAEGRPLRCYLFRRGALVYPYTNQDRNVTLNNIEFRSGYQISDGDIEANGESSASTVDITLNSESDISKVYRHYSPSQPLELTIWEKHVDDPDFIVAWMGRVANVKWPDHATCTLNCQSITAALESPGLSRCWTRACSNTLYDQDCAVPQELYRVDGVVNIVSGFQIEVVNFDIGSYPDPYFSGGFLTWFTEEGALEARGIRQQHGHVMMLLGGSAGLKVGMNVRLYPGCDLRIDTCANKFHNEDNYGGQPHQPNRSPFDGNPVF